MKEQRTNIKRDELYNEIIANLRTGHYAQVEQVCMSILPQNRRSPQLWAFLGEALFHQHYYVEAKRVFQRALLLDPQASWERAVFATLNEKLAKVEAQCREDIDQLLRVELVTVSAALIVRNEERSISRCIESIRHAVDEIVVLDTGSTDRTLQLLQRYPEVKVYHGEWRNDFAAARNEALQYVTTQWVMWIDADEQLHPEDVGAIKEAAGLMHDFPKPAAYIVGIMNRHQNKHRSSDSEPSYEQDPKPQHSGAEARYSEPHYAGARLFAMRHELRFWGRIHEQIGAKEGLYDPPLYGQSLRIRLLHDGYEPSIIARKNKLDRNITLLQAMLKEEPHNPAVWANLGREMIATGDLDRSLRILLQAEKQAMKDGRFARISDIHMNLVRIYIAKQDYIAAELVCRRAIEAAPDFPDSYYWLARIQLHWAKREK